MRRPLVTSRGNITHAPLVLVDLETDQGASGRTYLFAYQDVGARALRQLLAAILEMVRGDAVAPVAVARKLEARFTLMGREGLAAIAMAGVDLVLWDALARAAGLPLARLLGGEAPVVPPPTTMLGALYRYVHTADPAHFQPMNANFGLLEPLELPVKDKQKKRELLVERALRDMDAFAALVLTPRPPLRYAERGSEGVRS